MMRMSCSVCGLEPGVCINQLRKNVTPEKSNRRYIPVLDAGPAARGTAMHTALER